jgi:hypothetical protein
VKQVRVGRPPKGDFEGLTSAISMRMPNDMRAMLEASAAKRPGGGWSLTQEILHRLQRSFDRERDERRDPSSRALCYLLAEIISVVSRNSVGNEWRSNPFAFRAIKLAFTQILDALEPPGKIIPPSQKTGDSFLDTLWVGMATAGVGFEKTPEAMAEFACAELLSALRSESRESIPLSVQYGDRPTLRSPQREDFEFGMTDAKRALELKRGAKQ